MQLEQTENWLATRLRIANQLLAVLKPSGSGLIDAVRKQIESCQISLMDKPQVTTNDLLECFEQLQPVMAALRAEQSLEAKSAYQIIAHAVYNYSGTVN